MATGWEQAKITDHLVIEENQHRYIQGSVEGGVTIREGGVLVLQGALAGPVHVEGGGADVTGTISAESISIVHGFLRLTGVLISDTASLAPGLALKPGSIVIVNGRVQFLKADGTFEVHDANVKIDVDASADDWLYVLPDGSLQHEQDNSTELSGGQQ